MAKILGIGGVFLKADDPEGLFGWYERHLGLRRETGQVAIFPWRHADDQERKGMTVWSLFRRDTDYFGPSGQAGMINYIVDDLDGMLTDLRAAGVESSVGSVRDSYDDALPESVVGLFKTEVIRARGPWHGIDEVEFATLEWVHWFNNRRLLEPQGYLPTVEFEEAFHRGRPATKRAA